MLKIARFNPVGGSSWVPTPRYVAAKKATINVQNKKDQQCLRWCLLAHKHFKEGYNHANPYRVQCYQPFANDINMDGVAKPTSLKEVGYHIDDLTSFN